MRRRVVAIIGGGCSGTLTAINLLRCDFRNPTTVQLIDRSPEVGLGLAYLVPSDRCKLNVPVQGMSAFSDDPEGFLRWILNQNPNVTPDQFVSRRLYGLYLQDLLKSHENNPHGNTLEQLHAEATDIFFDDSSDTLHITLSSGDILRADACVLALGNYKRSTFCGAATEQAFYDPYRNETYQELCTKEHLLIVGTGLTSVDAILEAEGHGFRGRYTMLSRHGRLPLPHELPYQLSASDQFTQEALQGLSLRQLARRVIAEARRNNSSQSVMLAIRPYVQTLWQSLSTMEKRCFLRHVRPIWDIHRHRVPQPHHDTLVSLRAAGRLAVIPGKLRTITRNQYSTDVQITSQGKTSRHSFCGALLCAGPETDITAVDLPLIHHMLARELLLPGPLGLGVLLSSDPKHAQVVSRLALVGPPQRESLWEITAVREIRQEAEKLARRLCESLSLP